jgi:hypothetical protein
MRELDFSIPAINRRGFLWGCALLSLGGAIFGLPKGVARQSADESKFFVINGWVLPAQYFRKA